MNQKVFFCLLFTLSSYTFSLVPAVSFKDPFCTENCTINGAEKCINFFAKRLDLGAQLWCYITRRGPSLLLGVETPTVIKDSDLARLCILPGVWPSPDSGRLQTISHSWLVVWSRCSVKKGKIKTMKTKEREELIKSILTSYWRDQLVAIPSLDDEGVYLFYLRDSGHYMPSSAYTGTWSGLWDCDCYSGPVLDEVFGDCKCIYGFTPTVAKVIVQAIGGFPEEGLWKEV